MMTQSSDKFQGRRLVFLLPLERIANLDKRLRGSESQSWEEWADQGRG